MRGGDLAWYLAFWINELSEQKHVSWRINAHRDIVMTTLFPTWLRLHCIDQASASPTSLPLPTIRASSGTMLAQRIWPMYLHKESSAHVRISRYQTLNRCPAFHHPRMIKIASREPGYEATLACKNFQWWNNFFVGRWATKISLKCLKWKFTTTKISRIMVYCPGYVQVGGTPENEENERNYTKATQ